MAIHINNPGDKGWLVTFLPNGVWPQILSETQVNVIPFTDVKGQRQWNRL